MTLWKRKSYGDSKRSAVARSWWKEEWMGGERVFRAVKILCGFLGHMLLWLSSKESACPCRRHGFDPWVGKILSRREWKPTPVFLPGKSHGQRSLGLQSEWPQSA